VYVEINQLYEPKLSLIVKWCWDSHAFHMSVNYQSSHIPRANSVVKKNAIIRPCSQNFKLFGFPIFPFWAYLMKVFQQTRRTHYIWYLPVYYYIIYVIHLIVLSWFPLWISLKFIRQGQTCVDQYKISQNLPLCQWHL
jgi:hypothetical protein